MSKTLTYMIYTSISLTVTSSVIQFQNFFRSQQNFNFAMQQLSSTQQQLNDARREKDSLESKQRLNQISATSTQEQKQKQILLNREKTNIDIIIRAAADASKKGDHKQTIQITTSLLNNYPNSDAYFEVTGTYVDRAKAFAAIGRKDLAIKDLQQFDVLVRPLGNKELNSRVTSSISNLNRCGSMQCDSNTSITPQKVPEAAKIPK